MNVGAAWFQVVALACLWAGDNASPHERGQAALLGRSFAPAIWSKRNVESAWKAWKTPERPIDFDRRFRERYGLAEAPFANDGLPLGLRRVTGDPQKSITLDCMICHGGSLFGKGLIGLPNTLLDLKQLGEELTEAAGLPPVPTPFSANRTRGVTNAGAMGIFLMALRQPDFSRRWIPLPLGWEDMPDIDAPAWWLLKKKRTMYSDGGMSARSTRSIMQFLANPSRKLKELKSLESTWDDIREYISSIEPPTYPFAIDQSLAENGRILFEDRCSKCHGTYGENWTYPNRIVPLDEIGTDPARYRGIRQVAIDHYNKTWYGELHPATKEVGYQAPPLDAVWATAPYFHNGSAPTIYHVLNSKARPGLYRRHRSTNVEDFDQKNLGWRVEILHQMPAGLSPVEQRRIHDATRFGSGIGGHTFGDELSDGDRFAIIEYLKTI